MNRDEFAAELERDQELREGEIRFLQNVATGMGLDAAELARYRRSLVLMLYAHFEGSVKFALQTYLRFVNDQKLTVGEASAAIAAASLKDVLHALRDPQRKCDLFRRELPDDSSLHRFARDRELVDEMPTLLERRVDLSDALVDTDSNLKPVVLRKLLYQVGLDHRMFESHEHTINLLLELRNKISHGESLLGVSQPIYDRLRTATFGVMTGLKANLRTALDASAYRRVAAA